MNRSSPLRILAAFALVIGIDGSARCQIPTARDVVERFCELDSQGEQLTPGGWEKVADLFVTPGTPQRKMAVMVKDFVVSRPVFEGGKARFYSEYIVLGRIDLSQGRFLSPKGVFSLLPPGIKVREEFSVRKRTADLTGNGAAKWLIEGPVPEPHLTVDTAINFITKLREETTDPIVRKNAERSLAALKHFRQ